MFVKIVLSSDLEIGSIVSFSSDDQAWNIASSVTSPLGVVESVTQDSETLQWIGKVRFAGTAYALSDRAIPDEGGELAVINGRCFVDNSTDHAGIIAPIPHGGMTRGANELVMVHIR